MHQPALGNVTLPKLVGDSMILQRNVPAKIWGWALPGEAVHIQFISKDFNTITGKNGHWEITLPAMQAGGPYSMNIIGSNRIVLKDIFIGDVWVCAGQSNMVHQLGIHLYTYANEIKQDNFPQIRQFIVPATANLLKPDTNFTSGRWNSVTGQNLLQFSAVAYFFARKLFEKYHIPIGIINASVGGTSIEAWISEAGLKPFSDIQNLIQKNRNNEYIQKKINKILATNKTLQTILEDDRGITESPKWYDTNYIPKEWHNMNVPGYWNDQSIRNVNGVVWYRKNIHIPNTFTGIAAELALGRIVDADEVYINGILVGKTAYQYPQRYYHLPTGILKPGNNTIVIRITNTNGKGGFVPDKPYYIAAANDTIGLKGDWQFKVGIALPRNQIFSNNFSIQNQPAALYNGMIASITNYTIKGILWYQGESNISNAALYIRLFSTLIQDWRNKWRQGNLPFIYIQLPNYGAVHYEPTESDWAILREAQLKTLAVPNTGMAVTIDLGEWNDIHPSNKKEVGIRSALAAEKIAYQENNIVYSGPIYQSSKIESDSIIIRFNHVGNGLISIDGESLNQFAIAGADKKFVWANAKIENNTVVVWNKNIQHPVYVRYAWADNPRDANLYNANGLPAAPFRTDTDNK